MEENEKSVPSASSVIGQKSTGIQNASGHQARIAGLVLLAALTMTIFEGAFRKWVPSFQAGRASYLMYFSKDLIFACILLLPRVSSVSPALRTFQNWLLPGCLLIALGAFISCFFGVNLVGTVLTARALIILPLLSCLAVPRLTGLSLRRVLCLLLACTVLNFVLGTLQNRLPPEHTLNHYADADMQVVAMRDGVRATGTFSYIAGLSLICSVGIWVGMALMSLARNTLENAGAWVALATGIGCGLASISRAPIVIAVAMFGGWIIGTKRYLSVLFRGILVGGCCVIAAYFLGLTSTFTKLSEGLMERQASAADSFNERAFGQFGQAINALRMYPFGHGFGTEQCGGQFYSTGAAGFNHFESPLPRLVMECGFTGLAGFLMICIGAILALQQAKQTVAPKARTMLLATQIFLIPMFYGGVIFNHVASAFTWLIFTAVLSARESQSQSAGYGSDSASKNLEDATSRSRRKRPKLSIAPFAVRSDGDANNTKQVKKESTNNPHDIQC